MTRKTILLLLGVLLLPLVGCAPDDPAAATMPAPAPTVTVTESTEPRTETPQACLDALDYADEGFGIAATVIGLFPDALDAVMELDTDKLEKVTAKFRKSTKTLDKLAPLYVDAKEECRASA